MNRQAAVVTALILALAVWLTWKVTNSQWKEKWLARNATDLSAMLTNAQNNAAQEHDWQRKFAAIDADHQQKIKRVNDAKDRLIADYRAGNKRLRESLSCAAANMPGTATASGVRDAAAKCGLSGADVEFLIRYAADAQAVAVQLADAQALLRVIYNTPHQLQK